MLVYLKELFVVGVIAAVIFRLIRPLALTIVEAADFDRRRKVWFVLTAVAFFCPNFWAFVIVGGAIMILAMRREPNPGALYAMLLVIVPPAKVPVPMIGMPYLFVLDNQLLLAICLMLPAAWRISRRKDKGGARGFELMDLLLLLYGALSAVFYLHDESPDGGLYPGSVTESVRRAFVYLLGVYVPYYVISRDRADRRRLLEIMATYCVNCAVLVGVAVFESATHWLLYSDMTANWNGAFVYTMYVTRGESVRAVASTGHSMALGYMLVIGYGFWLYLQSRIDNARTRLLGTVLMWAGLIAAYTRGAWVGGVLIYFVFAALRPNPFGRVFKATLAAAVVGGLVLISPLGEKITSVLPFLGGHVDNFNVVYRQRLWDRSWEIIQQSPMLGDQGAMLKMQDLRQGQGIVDLVNTYVGVLLDNGFVGLILFMAFILIPLMRTWSLSRRVARSDPDFNLMGVSLVSCMAALLVLLENGSFGGISAYMFYALAAMGAVYAHLGPQAPGPQAAAKGAARTEKRTGITPGQPRRV